MLLLKLVSMPRWSSKPLFRKKKHQGYGMVPYHTISALGYNTQCTFFRDGFKRKNTPTSSVSFLFGVGQNLRHRVDGSAQRSQSQSDNVNITGGKWNAMAGPDTATGALHSL